MRNEVMKITQPPAKHTKSSFKESEAISKLKSILTTHRLVKPDLREGSTGPNHDGYLEVVDTYGYPKGLIVVQVRSLEQRRISKMVSYHFNDQKFLSFCNTTKDNPILFIGVDLENSVAYWREITPQYVKDLNNFTIYLPKENIISNQDRAYHKHWLKLCVDRQEAIKEYQNHDKQIYQQRSEKTRKKEVSNQIIEDTKQKLKVLFIDMDLKYKYYYPFIDLLEPFYLGGRGSEERKKLRQLFDITQDNESDFIKSMKQDNLIKIVGGDLCLINDLKKARNLQDEIINKNAIDLEAIIKIFL